MENHKLKLEEVYVKVPLTVIIEVTKLVVISYFIIYNLAKIKP